MQLTCNIINIELGRGYLEAWWKLRLQASDAIIIYCVKVPAAGNNGWSILKV